MPTPSPLGSCLVEHVHSHRGTRWRTLLAAVAALGGAATWGASPPVAAVPAAIDPAAALAAASAPRELAARLDLQAAFNADQGKVRVVAFLSPSCSHCLANALSLQKSVLAKLDSPDIAVHLVWSKVLAPDDREVAAKAAKLLTDARIHQYWDPKRLFNAQILDAIMFPVQVRIYDVFLLYDRGATWAKTLPRPGYWMHEFQGLHGPRWNPAGFADQTVKALRGQPLDTPPPPPLQ